MRGARGPSPVVSELVVHAARDGVDDPACEMCRESVVVALVDRDEAVVSLGDDVLVEVAVRSASLGNFESVEVSGMALLQKS